MKTLGGGKKPLVDVKPRGKQVRVQQHRGPSHGAVDAGAISRRVFVKAARRSTDALTAHSFCSIPPRHQSLLSGKRIKAEGRPAAPALPCLHLVNDRELTPISVEREGAEKKTTQEAF